jgi:hypothetical protein
MAGSNKSNSAKAKKRKIQLEAKARSDAAKRKNRTPYRGGGSSWSDSNA